jgi:hypothetical protein
MNTPCRNHEPTLLVDPGCGVLLDAPPSPIVTERYVETHPYVHRMLDYVIAGPDSPKVFAGNGGEDFITYEVVREVAGALHLERLS